MKYRIVEKMDKSCYQLQMRIVSLDCWVEILTGELDVIKAWWAKPHNKKGSKLPAALPAVVVDNGRMWSK